MGESKHDVGKESHEIPGSGGIKTGDTPKPPNPKDLPEGTKPPEAKKE